MERPLATTSSTIRSRSSASSALVVAVVLGGCVDYLDPGEVGPIRYFGEVRGASPLPLVPPVSDRDGNVYVLNGSRDLRQITTYTGQAGGGWSSGCALHKGDDRGAHGWIGRDQDHAWYWSGDALVEVSGETGSCTFVLDLDPASAASISFLGVVPSVRDSPSRTTVVALIQTPNEISPYWVVVDLRQHRYTELRRFEPLDAANVVVLGTGASDESGAGVMLVKYEQGGATIVEARYLDADANAVDSGQVTGLETALEDEVLGFLAVTRSGLASGVLADGRQVVFNPSGGAARAIAGMIGAGVHLIDDSLWLVGTNPGPVIAPVQGDGSVGSAQRWSSSERAHAAFQGRLIVLDDRAPPQRYATWNASTSAIGGFPFMSAATPHVFAEDTTIWLIAGPSYFAGGDQRTQIALAPIGVSYP